jgi:tetratricopeptide (TPR) repeat protein
MSRDVHDEVKVLISCVSDEFHTPDASGQTRFVSYRDSLAADLRRSQIKHVVQEDLVQGFGGLLQTLDEEVAGCNVVVHLIGAMSGASPKPEELRQLRLRHPQIFADLPVLLTRINESTPISYTQWELYLAYLHRTRRLLFIADAEATRSPRFRPDPGQDMSQRRHMQVVEEMGEHWEPLLTPDNLCRKVLTTLVARRVLSIGPPIESTEDDISQARQGMPSILSAIRNHIKGVARLPHPIADQSTARHLIRSLHEVAKGYNIADADLLGLLDEYQQKARSAVEQAPTPSGLIELAQAQLACGEYEQAAEAARAASRQFQALMATEPARRAEHRECALNACFLIADAASAAHRYQEAIQSLLEGGGLISRADEPVFWADYHEQVARTLMRAARYAEADLVIRDIIDLREQHLGENAAETNVAHMLLGRLLYSTGKYLGAEVVAARVLRSVSSEQHGTSQLQWDALDLLGEALEEQADYAGAEEAYRKLLILAWPHGPQSSSVAMACSHLAWILRRVGRYDEAETLFRRSLEITEKTDEANSLALAFAYRGVANVLRDTQRFVEAEALLRRALAIEENELGGDHPDVGTSCYEIGKVLSESQRHLQASEMFRRALVIDEKTLGPTHPFVGVDLVHLAQALSESGRIDEAENYWVRGSVILEDRRDSNHHRIGLAHWHLAEHRERQGRHLEALGAIQRGVCLLVATLGENHPDTCKAKESLARISKHCPEHM